ncbi:MAG TPA: hypothetical protein VL172_15640, partial [Kofleriaceae bacterium]|nr:hypothetical protein [Kofleriaceae bacterium]
ADEPTGNLDSQSGQEVFALMREMNRETGVAVIMVTHDDRLARAADLQVSGPAAIDALIGALPLAHRGARLRLAGTDVDTIQVPLLPTAYYRLDGHDLRLAVGAGVIERLLGPGPAPPPGATLLAAGLAPPRLPQLAGALRTLAGWLDLGGGDYYERTGRRLQRWESGQIRLLADGRDLVLTLGMRLR